MIFTIYKRGQGKYTRLCSAFAAAIIAGVGCWRLYLTLEAADLWGISQKVHLWVETLVPAGLFVVFALIISWLMNKSSIAFNSNVLFIQKTMTECPNDARIRNEIRKRNMIASCSNMKGFQIRHFKYLFWNWPKFKIVE